MAQANQVKTKLERHFPRLHFELKIIKTTGDKLQTASLAQKKEILPKGLFTKELENALLAREADLAVHSLKDLPTDLPAGLVLGAVCRRADVRDVLVYCDAAWVQQQRDTEASRSSEWSPGDPVKRGFPPGLTLEKLPPGATIATSSTRRQSQIQALRPDLRVVPIRGNVGTRLGKLLAQANLDATILAAAGLDRLRFRIGPDGRLVAPTTLAEGSHRTANKPGLEPGEAPPLTGLLATPLEPETLLPCVGQGAIGIETRAKDERVKPWCEYLDHFTTHQCVLAERAFLKAMGGGCQSPVAAYAQVLGHQIRLRAVSFREQLSRRAEACRPLREAVRLGEEIAAALMK